MNSPRVAVVEDNEDNRLVVRTLLEERFTVCEFESGEAALNAFSADPPDLVLLDISLPGSDGSEVLRQMRDDPALQELPVIALTAHAMAGDRERFLAQGFDDYVSKPIVDDEPLIHAIDRLLVARG